MNPRSEEYAQLDTKEIQATIHRLRRRGEYEEMASGKADEESGLLGSLFGQLTALSDEDVELVDSVMDSRERDPSRIDEDR